MAADTALDDACFGVQLMSAEPLQPVQAKEEMKTAPVEKPVAVAAPPIVAEPIAPAVQEQRLTEAVSQASPAKEPPAPSVAPIEAAEAPKTHEPASMAVQEETTLPTAEMTVEQAPTVQPTEAAPMIEEAAAQQPEAAEQPPVADPAPVEQSAALETPLAFEITPATKESAVEAPMAVDAETGEVGYTAYTPVEEIYARMTLEEARNIIVDIGTCKGQTLAWVSERRAASLKWYLNGYEGDNNMLRAGARLILESLAMNKAS